MASTRKSATSNRKTVQRLPKAARTRSPATRMSVREVIDSGSMAAPQIELKPWIVPAPSLERRDDQGRPPKRSAKEPSRARSLLLAAAQVVLKGRALIDKVRGS